MIPRIFWIIAVLATVSAPLDPFFDMSMSRHMLLQMPLLAGLGYMTCKLWPGVRLHDAAHAMSAITFAAGSLLFWMLPRSLDMAVGVAWVDQVMHANMLLAGWSVAAGIPQLVFHIKMAFGLYGVAMVLAAGAIFAATAVPVCSNYTVQQQYESGVLLLWAGGMLFVGLLIRGAMLLAATGADIGEDDTQPGAPLRQGPGKVVEQR